MNIVFINKIYGAYNIAIIMAPKKHPVHIFNVLDASLLFKRGIMMQYSKFMANLYNYDENIQKEISGVARFENIGKNVKIGVKLCFTKRENGDLRVYLIKRTGRSMCGKLIFDGKMRQRIFTMQKIITEEDMNNMGCRAGDIKGVYIIFNENRKFAALWESDKIDIDKIEIVENDENLIEDNVAKKVSDSDNKIENTDNRQESDGQLNNNIDSREDSQGADEKLDETENNLRQDDNEGINNPTEKSDLMENEEENNLSATETEEETIAVQGEKVNLMRLRELPKKAWKLSNNSFLLHGYYNYHYIYLKKEKNSWIVGVPGVYYPQEEKIAAIFGFRQFMAVSAEEKKKGVFGYWCKSVDISE